MQTFKTLADAVALAEFAHRNQTDKAGMPYIEHPRRVMQAVQTQGAMPYVQMAAILHDVTEDTAFEPMTLQRLGIPEAAVEIIKLVDRNYSASLRLRLEDSYPDWRLSELCSTPEQFYYQEIRKNPGAVQVKLADIGDNLQPWRLSYLPPDTQDRLRTKYAKAIKLLTGE